MGGERPLLDRPQVEGLPEYRPMGETRETLMPRGATGGSRVHFLERFGKFGLDVLDAREDVRLCQFLAVHQAGPFAQTQVGQGSYAACVVLLKRSVKMTWQSRAGAESAARRRCQIGRAHV